MAATRVAVIGAGAAGLTTSHRLLEAGFDVTVFARDVTPDTTSDVAAAFWSPGAIYGGPRPRRWALAGYEALAALAGTPGAGVDVLDLYNLYPIPVSLPDLAPPATPRSVPAGEFAAPWSGYAVAVPRIDVPVYMPWLSGRVRELGANIVRGEIDALGAIPGDFEVIVNSSGLGASRLTDDDVFPIRGQVMRVRKPADLPDRIIHTEADDVVTYIVPRSGDCLLGGTYQYYESSTDVDAAIAEAILDRCAAFHPALRDAEVLQHRVGLRPGRASVRLDNERLPDGRLVVHNYGHGSVGHTLSWGCAAEVVQIIGETLYAPC